MSIGRRLAVVALAASMFACTSTDDAATIALPPPNGGLDYQLGGAYEPTGDTTVLARDRTDTPKPGLYNICYVNGFQTQPGEGAMWLAEHSDLLLHNSDGTPVIDPEWPDEYILDTSSAEQREQLLAIVGEWIDGCAASGFQAVEIDNLDTYSRFPASLSADDAVEFARALAERAHTAGLAIGQKNAVDLVVRRGETDFDFAVVEQCNVYDECDQFTAGYDDQVYIIEYEREAFERGCTEYAGLSIVLRDVGLSVRGSPSHVYDSC
ncbi:MAG: endo alpha-1,4 polygalactosaminidase [Ilumatobacteraceae bacterium]